MIYRRVCFEKNEKAEIAIRNAIQEVELLGCSETLTDAVCYLQKAFSCVADFIDEKVTKEKK